jgi:hypothetical protein
MISQLQVEPAKYACALTMCPPGLICPAAPCEAVITLFLLLAPRTKPDAVIRPGLDALLKDIFLYMSPVSPSRSRKLHLIDMQRSYNERAIC